MKPSESSLWTERWRPQTFEDVIAPKKLHQYFDKIKEDGDISNLFFYGPYGTGKTTTALAIAKELNADYIHLNSSIDTSINDVRYKVQTFATSQSLFSESKKIVILDEMDRISSEGQDALKGLIELTSNRTRYIFITNHIERVHEALLSRTQKFSFGVNTTQKKELIKQFFNRVKYILDTEKVSYDSKVLAKFITDGYPDFRKIIGELQKFSKMNGEINEGIFEMQDEAVVTDLLQSLKEKKIDSMRKIVSSIDPSAFYSTFYGDMKSHIKNESIPTCIHILGEHTYRDGVSMNREINLAECCLSLMEQLKWKTDK